MDTPLVRDLVVLAAALVAGAGVFIVRSLVPPERLRENNEFTGFTYAFVGLVYGVYLAFTVVIWQHFDEAQTIVSREAVILAQLWRDVEPLPIRDPMRQEIYDYTKSVIEDEFPNMAAGRGAHPRTSAAVAAMWQTLQTARLTPGDPTQAAFFAEAVRQMNGVTESRRGRLLSGEATLPPPMWFLLIAGGTGMVAFAYLIGTPPMGAGGGDHVPRRHPGLRHRHHRRHGQSVRRRHPRPARFVPGHPEGLRGAAQEVTRRSPA